MRLVLFDDKMISEVNDINETIDNVVFVTFSELKVPIYKALTNRDNIISISKEDGDIIDSLEF